MIAYAGCTGDTIGTSNKVYEGSLDELMKACEYFEAAIIFDLDQPLQQGDRIPFEKTAATWVESRGWKDFEGGIRIHAGFLISDVSKELWS